VETVAVNALILQTQDFIMDDINSRLATSDASELEQFRRRDFLKLAGESGVAMMAAGAAGAAGAVGTQAAQFDYIFNGSGTSDDVVS
jgi:hypothetical protein